MKFLALIIIALLAIIAWPSIKLTIEKRREAMATPAPTPEPLAVQPPEPAKPAADAPRRMIKGTIEQHLATGHLLIRGYNMDPKVRMANTSTFVILGYPRAKKIADGQYIECLGVQSGLHEYLAVDGSNRTVDNFIYVAKDEADDAESRERELLAKEQSAAAAARVPATPIPQLTADEQRALIERKYGDRK